MTSKALDKIALPAVMAGAMLAAAVLVFWGGAAGAFGSDRAWELVTQFFLVAILGGGVTVMYRLWESRQNEERLLRTKVQDRKSLQRKALQDFHAEVTAIHKDYKKVRRTLRASSFIDQDSVKIERLVFEQLMDKLEDCQLGMENMYRKVDADDVLFNPDQKKLSDYLKIIEAYLRDLLRDYEDSYAGRRVLQPDDLWIVSNLVSDFIAKGRNSENLKQRLFEPAGAVRLSLVQLIEAKTP